MNPQVFPAIGIHKSVRNIVAGNTRDIVGRLSGHLQFKSGTADGPL
jgi:hypothetical protein